MKYVNKELFILLALNIILSVLMIEQTFSLSGLDSFYGWSLKKTQPKQIHNLDRVFVIVVIRNQSNCCFACILSVYIMSV